MESKLFQEPDSWTDINDNDYGVAFASHNNDKSKNKRKNRKRKHDEIEDQNENVGKWIRAPKYYGLEDSDENQGESPSKSKKRKERKRKHKSEDEEENEITPEKKVKKNHIVVDERKLTYEEKLRESLKGSRFRYINEQLYTIPSNDAMKIFEEDQTAFEAYHEGYRHQISQWPMNPLDRIIKQINKMPKSHVIVDMGAGDARLSKSVVQKVYSVDLVSGVEGVIKADMANVPIESGSVNVVVYCLSLMQTNLKDFFLEANRLLKLNGQIKIAEVSSRFEKVDLFIKFVQKCGFDLGFLIAKNPIKVIAITLLSVLISSLGFLNFHQERDPLKLWVPDNIDFLKHTKFIMNNYKDGIRTENVMFLSNNVLRPEIFYKLRIIADAINDIKITDEHGDDDVDLKKLCFKVPQIAIYTNLMNKMAGGNQRRRRSNDEESFNFLDMMSEDPETFAKKVFDPSFQITTKQYCSIVNKLKYGCMHESILDMWNDQTINITQDDIIEKLHTTRFNQISGHEANFTSVLGDITRNSSGYIVSAKALLTNFNLHLNFSQININRVGNAAGTEDWSTVNIMRFEEKFIILMEKLKAELETDDIKILYGSGRSYGDISSKILFQDINKMFVGVIIMMIYMMLILSKYCWPEARYILTSVGILNVGLAYVSGCGISSTFLFYSPVHASLFFIILGLGVDDIFVIMSAFRKVNAEHVDLSLEEKIAKTMQKAGASITITSLTDIIAFLVGSSTILPSLRSFCIFAAMCILMTYVYVVTFFVAVLTIDEKRVQQNRNGFAPCIKHKHRTPLCEPKLMWRFIHNFYGKIILTKIGKIIVILSVVVLTGFSISRIVEIKQKFDPLWFIPSSSYFYKYAIEHRHFFPDRGYEAGIYMGNLNYTLELPKIISMTKELQNRTDVLTKVEAWPTAFHEFMIDLHSIDVNDVQLNDTEWSDFISKFLFSIDGGKFQANFKFKENIKCGEPVGEILISSVTFTYHKFEDREQFIPARDAVQNIVRASNISANDIFVWGKVFGNWFTDEIIDSEIYRNIFLALVGVGICTLVMIVNLQVCLFIFSCVLLSLISVGGFMQLWGLTLDIVTSIGLQLSVGLCIDYAAHIGHTFLTISEGNGNKRALLTVETIGGAVLQGGGSTALAILLLAVSDAYTFRTFFKIFTIVVIFGLYYGTVFLPVVLSIFEPKPYSSIVISNNDDKNETELVLLNKNRIKIMTQNGNNNNNSCEIEKLNSLK